MSPLTHGSVSLREFYVEGDVARDLRRAYETPLRRHAFRPVAAERGETRAAGWVDPRQILDAEVSMEKLRVGPWVLLALRQDRLAINARLFRARRDLALSEAAKAKKTRLSRSQRQVIEEQVRLEMLRGQTPSTQIVEAAWQPEEKKVYVAAASDAAALVFSEVFAATFGLTLVPAVAAIRAMRWAEASGLEDRLADVAPVAFAAGRTVARNGRANAGAQGDDDGAA